MYIRYEFTLTQIMLTNLNWLSERDRFLSVLMMILLHVRRFIRDIYYSIHNLPLTHNYDNEI